MNKVSPYSTRTESTESYYTSHHTSSGLPPVLFISSRKSKPTISFSRRDQDELDFFTPIYPRFENLHPYSLSSCENCIWQHNTFLNLFKNYELRYRTRKKNDHIAMIREWRLFFILALHFLQPNCTVVQLY